MLFPSFGGCDVLTGKRSLQASARSMRKLDSGYCTLLTAQNAVCFSADLQHSLHWIAKLRLPKLQFLSKRRTGCRWARVLDVRSSACGPTGLWHATKHVFWHDACAQDNLRAWWQCCPFGLELQSDEVSPDLVRICRACQRLTCWFDCAAPMVGSLLWNSSLHADTSLVYRKFWGSLSVWDQM